MTKMRTVSIALASLVLLAGCTTDGGNPSDAPMGNSTQSQSTGENMPQVSGAANEAPTITAPTGNPPQELVTEDVITGSGATAEANSTLTSPQHSA